ncbi:hypothetical protein LIER_20278 [Lithospermum erythrorhizon]|uniref:Uncharacterized protein n=1 Tax=Lithospermum erythrorhizon TaxID=34254 RepID=A0AAV3QM02_LITER
MVRTRGGVNTSGKETKGKNKAEESGDDACRGVEPLVVEVEAQKLKKEKELKRGVYHHWLTPPKKLHKKHNPKFTTSIYHGLITPISENSTTVSLEIRVTKMLMLEGMDC